MVDLVFAAIDGTSTTTIASITRRTWLSSLVASPKNCVISSGVLLERRKIKLPECEDRFRRHRRIDCSRISGGGGGRNSRISINFGVSISVGIGVGVGGY